MSPPAIATYTINIEGGKINCTPSNGNGRFQERIVLAWNTNETCTLMFFTYDSNKQVKAWPFLGSAPTSPNEVTIQPGKPFQGTLRPVEPGHEAPSYAYSIAAGNHVLDPIIIVDK